MQMHKKLHLLLIGLSLNDVQLIVNNLTDDGYTFEHRQTSGLEGMEPALAECLPDVILCNEDILPKSMDSLNLMHSLALNVPFLLLSNNNDHEQTRTKVIQAGANNLPPEDNLTLLAASIENSLRESHIRSTQAALQENQARLSAFLSNLPGMAYQIRFKAGGNISFPYVSEGSMALFGLSPNELEHDASLFLNMLHKDDCASYGLAMKHAITQSSFWNWEGRIVMPSTGETKWINLRCSPRKLENGDTQWEGVMFNITQSKSAEIELNRSREELRALSLHVQDVREQERLNISREVHDNLGGLLTAIKLEVVRMSNLLNEDKSQEITISKGIENLVDKCIAAASNISRTLRPGALDSFGIIAAIELEIDEFRKRTGIQCEFTSLDEGDELDPALDIALFRIFQETLTNIIKHAQATLVKINILNQKHQIDLTVIDNGRGIADIDQKKPHSFGLRGIRERVVHLGGKFDINSSPNMGTAITVSIPRSPAGTENETPLSAIARGSKQ